MEGKLAEVELQHTGLQDLIATLKDGKGAQKVAEWHSKMEQLRLEQLKHKRTIERLRDQVNPKCWISWTFRCVWHWKQQSAQTCWARLGMRNARNKTIRSGK